MYNPGITTTLGSYAEVANSTIHLTYVDTEIGTGAKFCQMDVTLPWGTLDQSFGGYIDDVITRSPDSNRFYAIKITDINITNQSATFQVLSYARGSPANIGVTQYNLPSIVDPGSVVNYDIELTNFSTFNAQIRWLFASIVTTQTDTTYPTANSTEALPPTSYKKLGCWYDDWAIGGTCANGQTIVGNDGTTHITGNFTVTTNTGMYENIALRIFVYVSNYWGTGKHEYVEVGGSGLLHQLLANYSHLECVSGVCTRVTGAGTDTCTSEGSTIQCRHLECVSGVCTELLTSGTNTCNTIGSTTECLTTGSINCTSTPSGASVYLDDVDQSNVTPITFTGVSPGSHKVTYKLINYNDCNVNVTVTAGGTVDAPCTLVTTTQEITDIEIYYEVPWIYPKPYVDRILYLFKQDFDKGLVEQGYPNYSVQTTVYNEYTHIITVTIKKTYSLSTLNNSNINTLFFPVLAIVIVVVLIGGYLLTQGLIAVWLWGIKVLGAANVTPNTPAPNRTIRVNVYKVDESGNKVTLDSDAWVGYRNGNIVQQYKIDALSGFKEFTLAEGVSVVLSISSTGLIHELTPSDLTVNTTGNQIFDVSFSGDTAPVQDLNAGAKKTNGDPVTCGNYMARYAISGNLISEGVLSIDGKIATRKTIPGKKAYIIIVPCDLTKDKMTYYSFITASEPMNLDIFVKSCDEAKNTLSIILQRKKASGLWEFPLPDSVHITHPSGKILDLVSGSDYVPGVDVAIDHDGFEIGTHTVKIIRKDSTIITDTKPVTFDTDCFSSKQLIFDAEPIVNTVDVIIKVVRSDTKATVQGVYVYVDTEQKSYLTDNIGETETIYGLSYAKHTFTLKRSGFKDVTHELIIDASTSAIETLEIDSNLQVGNVDTVLINLLSIPSGDLIPNNDVKFEGELNFIDTDLSLKALGLASINIKIKDGLTTVKEYNVTTDQKLSLSPGKFRTPIWTLPKSLAKKDLDVTVSFNGSGNYKTSSLTQVFHVTEACCLNLPLIGCVASQTTCNTIKNVAIGGGLIIGGYLIYSLYKKVSPSKN